MGLLTARTCCFCLDLRAGGLALGYLFLLSACYGIVQPIFQSHHSLHYEYRDSPIFAAKIVSSQILLFASMAWLIGIYKKKASWMLAFVIYHFILFGAVTVLYFVYIGTFFMRISRGFDFFGDPNGWIFLMPVLPIIVIEWHFTAVVNSLYKNTKEENCRKLATPSLYPVIENEV